MKTIATSSFRSLAGKIVLGLVMAAMLGGLDAAPAAAGDHGNRGDYRGDRHNEYRGRGHDRGYWGRDRYNRRVYRAYGYVEPVYVAPPVYYAPLPEPGVSIFLPSIRIH